MKFDLWRDRVRYINALGYPVEHWSITVWAWIEGRWSRIGHANDDAGADEIMAKASA